MDSRKPVVLVVMGVCGSGKTSVAEALGEKLNWPIAEADDFHPTANKQKMAAGIPLTDQDRFGWLLGLHGEIKSWLEKGICGLVTCSALKKSYRQLLQFGENLTNANTDTSQICFIYLKGSKDLLMERMSKRSGHFMPTSLVQSQLDTLEEPSSEENSLTVGIENPLNDIVELVATHVANIK